MFLDTFGFIIPQPWSWVDEISSYLCQYTLNIVVQYQIDAHATMGGWKVKLALPKHFAHRWTLWNQWHVMQYQIATPGEWNIRLALPKHFAHFRAIPEQHRIQQQNNV